MNDKLIKWRGELLRFVILLLLWLMIHFALVTNLSGQDNKQVMKLYDQIKNALLDEQKFAEVIPYSHD